MPFDYTSLVAIGTITLAIATFISVYSYSHFERRKLKLEYIKRQLDEFYFPMLYSFKGNTQGVLTDNIVYEIRKLLVQKRYLALHQEEIPDTFGENGELNGIPTQLTMSSQTLEENTKGNYMVYKFAKQENLENWRKLVLKMKTDALQLANEYALISGRGRTTEDLIINYSNLESWYQI
jgi:hypothetical protein